MDVPDSLMQGQRPIKELLAARERESTRAYKKNMLNEQAGGSKLKHVVRYGTISQGVRAFRLRRARYIILAKIHLQHVLMATAINFCRISNWLADVPREKTRRSAFEKLMKFAMAT